MIYGCLIKAVILILSGLLVKNNPYLIAGYNSLSNEEKEQINTDKLTQMTRNYLVSIGVGILIIGVSFYAFNVSEKIQLYLVCGSIICGITLLIIQSFKLNLIKS